MATYIVLGSWTEQGIREVKNSPSRLDQVKGLLKSLGGEMKAFYMTMGAHDFVCLMEAPGDEAMAQGALRIAMGGAVRTTTLKAFPEAEYRKIIGSLG